MKKYKKVVDLLSKKSRWTKFVSAIDKEGLVTNPTDNDAISFCLTGAVVRCYPNPKEQVRAYKKIQNALKSNQYPKNIVSFNDSKHTKFKHIRKILKKADV